MSPAEITISREASPPRATVDLPDLAFVDVETTGLDPHRHEIIEIAVIRVRHDSADPSCITEIDTWSSKVRPQRIELADSRALAINGYDHEKWERDALELRHALDFVAVITRGAALAGNNVPFDRDFICGAAQRCNVELEIDYHLVDVAAMAWPLRVFGEVEGVSLRKLCDRFGVSNEGAHRALADAQRSLAVYRALISSGAHAWGGAR